ncbi:MAG: hypothetical protein A2X86_09200 [Bdellovibrionales bacterium GWA2_49_15]|nr:MAG: hypothetical protein A2X86_09200 [Bdellovibrionales bacterium GWA2_49_15]HAZ12954.1 hypothetical protein [Bdellovibrionales bacterium]
MTMLNKMELTLCPNASVEEIQDNKFLLNPNIEEIKSLNKVKDYLFKLSDDDAIKSNIRLSECIELLAHVCGFALIAKDFEKPFKHLATFPDGSRTASPDDLKDHHIPVLDEFLKIITNDLIQARLNDVLWNIRIPKNFDNAKNAIKYYLSFCGKNRKEKSESIHEHETLLRRCLSLVDSLRLTDGSRDLIIDEIKMHMFLEKDEPNNFIRFHYFKLLCSHASAEEYTFLKSKGRELIEISKKQNNFEKARAYIDCIRHIYKLLKDKAEVEKLNNEHTDMFIDEVRTMRKAGGSAIILQNFYNKAISACRATKGRKEEAKELIDELKEIQPDINDGLKAFSAPIDITDSVAALIKEIEEKSFIEGIETLCFLSTPPSKRALFSESEKMIKEYPLQSLISNVMLDEKGKLIAKTPGLDDNETNQNAVKRSFATQQLSTHFTIKACLIDVARGKLRQKKDFDEKYIESLLYPNPFVPTSRIVQFKAGLLRGFDGDWISASSILIPLLENSFRHMLEQLGINMISIDSNEIQKERDLNSFIYSEEFEKLVGKDLQFYMQVLLTDHTGLNFRNNIAHGLCADHTVLSEPSQISWALTLFLCKRFQERFIELSKVCSQAE